MKKIFLQLLYSNFLRCGFFNTEVFFLSSKFKLFQGVGRFMFDTKKSLRLELISASNPSLVSIVLPAFNSQKTIKVTIESIQSQNYNHWQLLVIDDGSIDNTLKIVVELAKLDPRIKIYHNTKNKGAAYARNVGLYYAKGDYITFHDADDTSHPDRLEYQLAGVLSNPKIEIVITQYIRVDAEGEAFILNGRKKRNYVSGMMFRKKVIDKIGYFKPLKISEDSEYYERIIATFGRQSRKILCKTLYYALFRPNSLLFSNANVSINGNSINYKIHDKELSILEAFRAEHKRIRAGELSPYQSFVLDEKVTKYLS